ncbi:MAG: hypothetical protein NC089_13285 [Bacteroides sp.]|nr:hypothetical protein [Bacteroides sp.]MCM1550941.1 hypothetical protein [Clostridium sp.]
MRQKGPKQILCYILVLLLVCSGIVRTEDAYGGEEGFIPAQLAEVQKAKKKALEWLEKQQGEDGRAGNSPLVNDTCMVLEQFQEEEMEAASLWLEKQLMLEEHQNTDILSRSYCAFRKEELLECLVSMQNPDGGWGLTSDYESEGLDSMLALEAWADTEAGPEKPVCSKLITYLRSIQQEDGGFAYMEGMESDLVLTLRIGIAAARLQDRQTGIHLSLGMLLRDIDKWMEGQPSSSGLTETFEEGAYRCLYRLNRKADMEGAEETLLQELLALQQEDGSFGESISHTVLGVRLLRAWEEYYTPYVRIADMETSLSTYTIVVGRTTELTVTTACEYAVNYDTGVTWRLLLCEGGQERELWTQTGTLDKGENEITFEHMVLIVAEPGKEYSLKAELLTAGEVIGETDSTLYGKEIVDRKLVLDGEAVAGEAYTVRLSWNDVSDEDYRYGYRIYRRTGDGEWETRSSWDAEEEVRVLNIYPCKQAEHYLIDWMNTPLSGEDTPAGQNLFDIDTVLIDDYNREPERYLKDEAGNYQYDVLFFGTYDSNAFKDLTEESYEATQAFADSGRGILFGHDTVCLRGREAHPQFARFADQMGIKLSTTSADIASSRVRVINSGFLTSYPWKIEGDITVPPTHSLGQYTGGTLKATVWMELDRAGSTDEETGGISNAYLFSRNQLAMIQTGHSNGRATDDERKIIANTLFYLKQLTHDTEAVDRSAYDKEAPAVTESRIQTDSGQTRIEICGEDYGTQYEYYVEAIAEGDAEGAYRKESNPVVVDMVSGIRGYLIGINDSSTEMDNLISYDAEGRLLNLHESNALGSYTYVWEEAGDTDRYIHIRAVDYAGNISEETVVKLEAGTTVPEKPSDIGAYFHTGYALFSTEDTVVYGSDLKLYGVTYAGTGMTFGGNSIYSDGAIRSTGIINTYAGSVNIPERLEQSEAEALPDYRASILADMSEDSAMQEIAVYDSTSIETPVHCQSTTGTYCPNLHINASLLSESSIYISTDQAVLGGTKPVAICSAHGDINVNSMTLSGSGIIYAPEGTVTINVSRMDFKGSIIAKRIVLQGDMLYTGTEKE